MKALQNRVENHRVSHEMYRFVNPSPERTVPSIPGGQPVTLQAPSTRTSQAPGSYYSAGGVLVPTQLLITKLRQEGKVVIRLVLNWALSRKETLNLFSRQLDLKELCIVPQSRHEVCF